MLKLILFALLVLICSCGGSLGTKQTGVGNKIKRLQVFSKPDTLITKISSIASDIEYISLQKSSNTQIKAIDKIISRGNKFYINLVNNIFCFDDQGRFLYKLYGNEKNENKNIVAIYDFDIDTGDKSLIVLGGNKITLYENTGTGFDHIKTIKLRKLSPAKLDFVPYTNKILLTSIRRKGNEPTLNILINNNGDTLSLKRDYFKRFNPVQHFLWDEIIHYQFDHKLYLRERFNDTVFSIDTNSNTFIPTLNLDSRLSSSTSENINDPDYFKILPNVYNMFEVSRYLYYEFIFNQVDHKVIYDKYDNRKYEIDPENGVLKDDIAGGPDFDPDFCVEGNLYAWITARELKKWVKSESFTKSSVQNAQKKMELNKLGLSLKESDNPILISVIPKK